MMLWAVMDRIAVRNTVNLKVILGVYVRQDKGKCLALGLCLGNQPGLDINTLLHATGVPKPSIYKDDTCKKRETLRETTDGGTCMVGDHEKLRLVKVVLHPTSVFLLIVTFVNCFTSTFFLIKRVYSLCPCQLICCNNRAV